MEESLKMKAWLLEDIGNIKYKEVLKPQISENEVLVQVKSGRYLRFGHSKDLSDRRTPNAADSGTRIFRSGGTDR